jgi:chromosome partitioning protein
MQIWAVANQKGGVGKTTTAVTLAGLLARRRYRVLLVDFDPHGSLTSYFGGDPDHTEHSAYDLFHAAAAGRSLQLAKRHVATGVGSIRLLQASAAMATLDRQLGSREGMGLVLKRSLAEVAQDFDVTLVDCPPMLGLLMVNALAACEHVIIPVQTEFLAIKGLDRMLHTLEMLSKSRGRPLRYTIVPTFFDRRTRASVDARRRMHELYKGHLWESVIPIDTQFRDASREGVPLPMLDPNARGVLAYQHLLKSLPLASRDAAAEGGPA